MTSGTEETRSYRSVRRAEAAGDTRARILAAAMRLFVEKGYGKVTVSDIAREAAVAVPTVYASAGGKTAILATIIDEAVHDPIVEKTLAAVRTAREPREVIDVVANGTRVDNERYHDIIEVNRTASVVDEIATEILENSNRAYRQALAVAVSRLREMGVLRDYLTDERATDVLWFYFGHQPWHALVAESGWTWDEAEDWLREQAAAALLQPS
ncbi:TetR/AcrR family transcriptional regulator [Mycobacterium sp. NPDC048908]|uniref:TetR/AcrR family transcriptional regulator n=1 Tax=Mycobacterium sp. NPDC048908 TaxID=3364292 RepID=UPI003721820B